jgi:hypothetical protein
MLRRLGFRHLLPPLQLFLYCVLCFCGYRDRQRQKPCTNWISSERTSLAQNEEDFPLPPPCREPKAWLVAGSLNAPAQMAGTILAAILATALHCKGDLWSFATSAPLVVLLWYWVGLWIDRRLGYAALRHGRFPRILAKVAHGFSMLLVLFSAIMTVRALISQSQMIVPYVVAGSFACWSVFLFVVTSLFLRQTRPPFPSGMKG